MLVVPTPSTIRSSTPSDESPLLVVPPPLPLINELQPTNTSSSSPVKTRRTCRNCKILRKSLAKCIAEKITFRSKRHKKCKPVVRRIEQAPTTDNEKKRKRIGYHELPPKRLREYLNRRDETIEKFKKKRNTEREVSSPAENKMQILQDKIRKMERAERIYKKKIVSLETNLKRIKKVHGLEFKDLEMYYQNTNLELEEKLDSRSDSLVNSDFRKDGKCYNFRMRILVYHCLMANEPTDRVPSLIETFDMGFRVKLSSEDIPVKSSVENMVVELGLLSDLQVAETLYTTENITISMDSTTQEGCHVNEVHTTTNDQCLVVALDELPGGTARDYADHVVKSVEHLASVHYTFHDNSEDTMAIKDIYKIMSSHITCSLTDRAAANHAAIRIVSENLEPHL